MAGGEVSHGIKLFYQLGNYFIMDSEALVSNPFQDLPSEVMAEVHKKASLTEKLISVRNNVWDKHYTMAHASLERQKTDRMRQLDQRSSKLRYEVKLLGLDRQKNGIDLKKRVMPYRDYSFEENQITKKEKRLGTNVSSYYLERKMKYPPRIKSLNDISTTSTVIKARKSLKHQIERSATDPVLREKAADESDNLLTLPLQTSDQEYWVNTRRNSLSAPMLSRSKTRCKNTSTSHLPTISDSANSSKKQSHVKFGIDKPLNKPTHIGGEPVSSAPTFTRANTYPSSTMDNKNFIAGNAPRKIQNDAERDCNLLDEVDLQSLLLNTVGTENHPISVRSISKAPITPTLHCSNSGMPRINQELVRQESLRMQHKVEKFLHDVHLWQGVRQRAKEDSDRTDEPAGKELSKYLPSGHIQPQSLQNILGDNCMSHNGKLSSRKSYAEDHTNTEATDKAIIKDAWKHIKGQSDRRQQHNGNVSEKMFLQSLNGVSAKRSPKTAGIPHHSAARAARHTATFKMIEVIRKPINERTKYQQREIEELKLMMRQEQVDESSALLIPPDQDHETDVHNSDPSSSDGSHTKFSSSLSTGSSRQ